MQATCLGYQAQSSSVMYRISTVLRNASARAVAGGWAKRLPIQLTASSAAYTSSAILLRGRYDSPSSTNRQQRSPNSISPFPARPLDISAGGGARPKKPIQFRTKNRRGSVARAEKLVGVIRTLSNSKEDIFGTLDAFIAWDLEFPLITVKKALKLLRDAEEWRRIIQVSKWMLDKGQGKTLATYHMLLESFDHEGRIEEAEVLWDKVLRDNMESIPRSMFALMIRMYNRYEKSKLLLKVFADMEELQVKPDPVTVDIVAKVYAAHGYEEYGQSLYTKYPSTNLDMRRRRMNSYNDVYVKRANADSTTNTIGEVVANASANENAIANVS